MKKYLSIIAVALFAIACAKETPLTESPTGKTANPEEVTNKEQKDQEDPSQTVHELFVSIASVEDSETKAAIANTDGAFTWTEGDKIAVVSGVNVYPFTAAASGSGAVRFTYEDEITGTPTDVYYPYDSGSTPRYLTNPPTSVSGLEGALSGTNLRLHGKIVDGAATLCHTIALLKVTFTNVPTFASSISFDGNKNDVTITDIGDDSTISAYIPVDSTTTSFTVSLLDANSNAIISKSTSGKTFKAGTLKKMKSLTVGHVVTMADGNSWENPKIHIWNGGSNADFTTDGSYPHKLNSYPSYSGTGNKYYVVLNTVDYSWATEGASIGVQYTTTDNSPSTQTDCVYLYRDIDFTSPSGNAGMETDYRIYPYGGSYTSPYIRAYYDAEQAVSIKVDCSKISFGKPYIHIGFGAKATDWSKKESMEDEGKSIYSYTFPSSYFKTSGIVVISNSINSDGWKSVDYTADFTAKKSYTIQLGDGGPGNPATVTQTGTEDFTHTEIFGVAPGTSFTSPSSMSAENYMTLSSTLYGKNIYVIFSDNGESAKDIWNITANRDYNYGL